MSEELCAARACLRFSKMDIKVNLSAQYLKVENRIIYLKLHFNFIKTVGLL